MRAFLRELEEQLEQLTRQRLRRRLMAPEGVDFASNDYLGLAGDPCFRKSVLKKIQDLEASSPLTAPASRLLRGNFPEHQTLEQKLARFKGTEASLLFPSGYQANLGALTALISPNDRVLSDAQNHASIIDGLRLCGCRKVIYPHLDAAFVENTLRQAHPGGRSFLVTESLFSMDGDRAPLSRYADLAERYHAQLIVDDAHATGLFGKSRGSGLTEEHAVEKRCLAIISTFGKALGLFGAFVSGPAVVIDWLINRCRPFIFSTAVPPILILGVDAALEMIQAQPQRRERVLALADRLRTRLRSHGVETLESSGPIVPVILGNNQRALEVADQLQSRGFDVRAIRPPTVAAGTARLRISVHASHTRKEMEGLADALLQAVERTSVTQNPVVK